MIVQIHKHLDGSIAYMRFNKGGYTVTLEKPNIETGKTIFLRFEQFQKHELANEWMEKERGIRRN